MGDICWKYFTIPRTGVSFGTNTILVEGYKPVSTSAFQTTPSLFWSYDFVLFHPSLNLVTPTAGEPGSSISINGADFPINTGIKVFVGGQLVTTITSSGNGAVTGSFTVPTLSAGIYFVELTWDGGMPSQLDSSKLQQQFQILAPPVGPTISLSPTNPTFGQYVTVTGKNFPPYWS